MFKTNIKKFSKNTEISSLILAHHIDHTYTNTVIDTKFKQKQFVNIDSSMEFVGIRIICRNGVNSNRLLCRWWLYLWLLCRRPSFYCSLNLSFGARQMAPITRNVLHKLISNEIFPSDLFIYSMLQFVLRFWACDTYTSPSRFVCVCACEFFFVDNGTAK